MFKNGIHLLEENVWDCSNYKFKLHLNNDLPVTNKFSKNILRIPNNSHLSKNVIKKIAINIKNISNNL